MSGPITVLCLWHWGNCPCGPAHRTLPVPAACTPENPLCQMNNTFLGFCEDACHFFTCHSVSEYPARTAAPAACPEGAGAASSPVLWLQNIPPARSHLEPAGKEIGIYRVPTHQLCTEPLHRLWAKVLHKPQVVQALGCPCSIKAAIDGQCT